MERTEVAMVVLIGLVVYFLGVDIHESAMEAFLALIRYNQLKISKGNSYICVNYPICQALRNMWKVFQGNFLVVSVGMEGNILLRKLISVPK